MKKLLSILILVTSMNTLGMTKVTEEEAINIAREYAYDLGEEVYRYVETTIEDQIASVWYEQNRNYFFVMYDGSGDCALVVAVNYNGKINQWESYDDWSCE